jgi:hypothetical protein
MGNRKHTTSQGTKVLCSELGTDKHEGGGTNTGEGLGDTTGTKVVCETQGTQSRPVMFVTSDYGEFCRMFGSKDNSVPEKETQKWCFNEFCRYWQHGVKRWQQHKP